MSDLDLSPPPLGLTPDEAEARFRALQSRMAEQWRLIRSMNQLEQTMVVVPSGDPGADATGSEHQAQEERLLTLLLLLRKPRARIIYCTSQPILDSIVDYYIGLLPGVIPSHARARLLTLSVHDASPRPLALKILERPRFIERIRELIVDRDTTHLVPASSSLLERDLALRLGIPMYGAEPRFGAFSTPEVARQLFAEVEVPHLLAIEGVGTADEICDAIADIRARRAHAEQIVIRPDDGSAGAAFVDLADLPTPGAPNERAEIAHRLRHLRLSDPAAAVEPFMAAIEQSGATVAEQIVAEVVHRASVQMRISPLGDVEALSTHDQVSVASGGPVNRFPADPRYAPAITADAIRLGQRLCADGLLGRFEVGFLVAPGRDGGWRHYATHLDLSKGPTTASFLTLEFLTAGRYDHQAASFLTATGRPKVYLAGDRVQAPCYRAITPDDLFDFVVRHGLHFDHTTQSGVVLNMLSAVSERGCFGLTAVADSYGDATELYDRTIATLGFESERAATDPGLPAD